MKFFKFSAVIFTFLLIYLLQIAESQATTYDYRYISPSYTYGYKYLGPLKIDIYSSMLLNSTTMFSASNLDAVVMSDSFSKFEWDRDSIVKYGGIATTLTLTGTSKYSIIELSKDNPIFYMDDGKYLLEQSLINGIMEQAATVQDGINGFYRGGTASSSFSNDLLFSRFTLQTNDQTPVPEPGTMMLLGIGMAGLVIYGKRRMSKGA
ncbi:MAG: PEP-CTERM sorting domain-containing protein [Desulfuromonadaceae bacterium]|nr:PEP-CTERM sorting domain-containing protein [Desulfuromonadaceae bacterium]